MELLECTQRDVEPVRKIPVLIVEDEVLIRMHLVDILDHEGFTTVEVGSASEAVSMLEGRPDIRVVFTDIEMPGTMNGLALSHYVRHRWPPTIIVVNSGQRRPDLKGDARWSTLHRKAFSIGGTVECPGRHQTPGRVRRHVAWPPFHCP